MLGELLYQVLNESVASVDKITRAIDNHSKIIVTYKPITPDREHATGPRLIGIFAYGQTKASNDCVRVYEYAGDTASFVPNWKILRLDQFLTWKPTGQIYTEPPDSKFNPNGDKTMSVVFKIAKFDNDITTNPQQSGPKTKESIFMTPTERKVKARGEQIRKQIENPIYISDLKAKQGMKDYIKNNDADEFTEGPKTMQNVKQSQQPEKPQERQHIDYKDEVSNMFSGLRDKLKNADKIDLSQFNKYKKQNNKNKELSDFRKKLGDTSKPIRMDELKRRLGMDNRNKE